MKDHNGYEDFGSGSVKWKVGEVTRSGTHIRIKDPGGREVLLTVEELAALQKAIPNMVLEAKTEVKKFVLQQYAFLESQKMDIAKLALKYEIELEDE